ncbi:response regulator [Zeaxanthinibacter enoshimensis]|uniref:Response regulator receiver domain-containing protein n=1 Tax=Zeaxanthinibacter enoshimensis TaxID=392009 RepID=A0A4V6PWC7_9FLAO|nr:response regulator [Zeaxanthinibacter enoshimensis]TDQ33101.1 response regulator receiver domain-containing protein [Zeaxanthinibacter enoshimensis]
MKKIRTSCIIDDDPIFIYGTKRIMKEVNFCDEVLVYQNGQQALDGLSSILDADENFPSVIFLDLNMPIMNGWEFLEELTKITHPKIEHLIIYIISSSIDPRDLERVKDYEIVHNYILKPVTPKDLSTVMEVLHDY